MSAANKVDGWLAVTRWPGALLFGMLALVACGGGGGGGGDSTAAPAPVLEGIWRVSLTQDGTPAQGGTVAAADVPSQQQVAAITTASFAQILGSTTYEGYTVVLGGGTLTITGPATNAVIVINSLSTSNYKGCGLSCGAGATVSYDVSVTLTANGTLNGESVSGTNSGKVTVGYTRVS